jgi:hypothetical protein
MHELMTIYRKVRKTLNLYSNHTLNADGNLNFYPNPPKMSDFAVMSLSITAECIEIDSVSLLCGKYAGL